MLTLAVYWSAAAGSGFVRLGRRAAGRTGSTTGFAQRPLRQARLGPARRPRRPRSRALEQRRRIPHAERPQAGRRPTGSGPRPKAGLAQPRASAACGAAPPDRRDRGPRSTAPTTGRRSSRPGSSTRPCASSGCHRCRAGGRACSPGDGRSRSSGCTLDERDDVRRSPARPGQPDARRRARRPGAARGTRRGPAARITTRRRRAVAHATKTREWPLVTKANDVDEQHQPDRQSRSASARGSGRTA